MSFRQYAAAAGVALFSPVTRLLPKAVLERAGFSGWLAPLAALPLLVGLVWLMGRLLRVEGHTVGLGEALICRLGPRVGRAVAGLLLLWLLFYGGVLLRSGAERILSTVYPRGSLALFLCAGLALSLVFASGQLRWAGRSAAVTLLFFAFILMLVFLTALPTLHWSYVWPPDLSRWPEILVSALPAAEVLSVWVFFTFLRGRVTEDAKARPRGFRGVGFLTLLTLLFLLTTIGELGPELALRQEYPFYVMIKNLRLFNLLERFDAVIVALWVMTDHICVGMLLFSASVGLQTVTGSRRRAPWVFFGACGMLLSAATAGCDAFRFAGVSERLVPAVNLGLIFVLLPLTALFPAKKENLRFFEK